MTGFRTLLYKERLRFWKVATQTITAPIVTAMLYLLIFGHVLEDHVKVYGQIGYTAFLIPGLVMMSILSNAFQNSSSSIVIAKVQGNAVDFLMPPISALELARACPERGQCRARRRRRCRRHAAGLAFARGRPHLRGTAIAFESRGTFWHNPAPSRKDTS